MACAPSVSPVLRLKAGQDRRHRDACLAVPDAYAPRMSKHLPPVSDVSTDKKSADLKRLWWLP